MVQFRPKHTTHQILALRLNITAVAIIVLSTTLAVFIPSGVSNERANFIIIDAGRETEKWSSDTVNGGECLSRYITI